MHAFQCVQAIAVVGRNPASICSITLANSKQRTQLHRLHVHIDVNSMARPSSLHLLNLFSMVRQPP